MDKDEIDRLVKETKAKAEARTDDDVDMTAPQSSQAALSGNERSTRSTTQPKAAYEGKTKEQQEAEDERQAAEEEQAEERREAENQLPIWAVRLVPGCDHPPH